MDQGKADTLAGVAIAGREVRPNSFIPSRWSLLCDTHQDIAEVRACLHGYPPYMKVQVRGDIPVIVRTVADLCSLSHGRRA
jgi:hypothetical protein